MYKRDKLLSKLRRLVKNDFPNSKMRSIQINGIRRKGIYRLLNKERERIYFFKTIRKSIEDCNMKSLLSNPKDNIMLGKLERLQLKGYKKVVFLVGDNLHWLSL
jgi:hypothetical protein